MAPSGDGQSSSTASGETNPLLSSIKSSSELAAAAGSSFVARVLQYVDSTALIVLGLVMAGVLLILFAASAPGGMSGAAMVPSPADFSSTAFGCTEEEALEKDLVLAQDMFQRNLWRFKTKKEWWRSEKEERKSNAFVADKLVPTYPCMNKERLGTWGLGGHWVCLRRRPFRNGPSSPVVVSVGLHNRTGFELDVFKKWGAVSHAFDPFMTPMQDEFVSNLEYLRFYRTGLVGSGAIQQAREQMAETHKAKYPNPTALDVVTIAGLLTRIGENYVDILKIDCEGCEYEVVKDLANQWGRREQPVGQILMEMHDVRQSAQKLAAPLLATLDGAGYRLFHVEHNGYCKQCFEVAFIHESLVAPRKQ